jgi:hypothetical protein
MKADADALVAKAREQLAIATRAAELAALHLMFARDEESRAFVAFKEEAHTDAV